VLKINLQPHKNGAEKIERGEFAIFDLVTNRVIDLSVGWDTCFSPGQRVEMYMVYRGFRNSVKKECPKCHQALPAQTKPTRSKLAWWVPLRIDQVLTLTDKLVKVRVV